MDGRHLGAEKGIGLPHFLCEDYPVVGAGHDVSGVAPFLSYPQGGDQGADPDPGSSQVIDLIDLQDCIDLPGAGENIIDLVRGDGVQAAAKGVQLDQIQVIPGLYKGGCGIKPGVVHPLVGDDQRPLHLCQMGNGILGQHRKSV